jgi:hypothetical protein
MVMSICQQIVHIIVQQDQITMIGQIHQHLVPAAIDQVVQIAVENAKPVRKAFVASVPSLQKMPQHIVLLATVVFVWTATID